MNRATRLVVESLEGKVLMTGIGLKVLPVRASYAPPHVEASQSLETPEKTVLITSDLSDGLHIVPVKATHTPLRDDVSTSGRVTRIRIAGAPINADTLDSSIIVRGKVDTLSPWHTPLRGPVSKPGIPIAPSQPSPPSGPFSGPLNGSFALVTATSVSDAVSEPSSASPSPSTPSPAPAPVSGTPAPPKLPGPVLGPIPVLPVIQFPSKSDSTASAEPTISSATRPLFLITPPASASTVTSSAPPYRLLDSSLA